MAGVGPIWIQGAGELASGVAWRLARCGWAVVLAEIPQPLAVRRLVCYSEAVHEGRHEIEGLAALRQEIGEDAPPPGRIGVRIDPEGADLAHLAPAALVDARMTKRRPATLASPPPLIIGLGPGFLCGRDADFIIETHRESRMGSVLDTGTAAADTGIPGSIGGRRAARLLRSPAAGRLDALCRIGDRVTAGQVIGRVDGVDLVAGLDGLLRGLVRTTVELKPGWKVGDIDPRGADVDPRRISDKALAVAGGVLEALLRVGIHPPPKADPESGAGH